MKGSNQEWTGWWCQWIVWKNLNNFCWEAAQQGIARFNRGDLLSRPRDIRSRKRPWLGDKESKTITCWSGFDHLALFPPLLPYGVSTHRPLESIVAYFLLNPVLSHPLVLLTSRLLISLCFRCCSWRASICCSRACTHTHTHMSTGRMSVWLVCWL